ncbi:50S ribosomal protein L9 [Patescibacteria group bacterium]|nr:50S ribosomal protein L9 [Patescibacteria group bacterium]
MKVLLTKNVASVGNAGEVKNVADGYARNYLIPQKMGILATSAMIKEVEAKQKANASNRQSQHQKIDRLTDRLAGSKLVIKAKTSQSGTLFAAISPKEISRAISEQTSDTIDPKNIELESPIKEIGQHQALLKFPDNIKIKIRIEVTN